MTKSVFCTLMISNGLAVAFLCFLVVRPVYVDRALQLGTVEAKQTLNYLYGLIGLGLLVSTAVALISLMFLGKNNGVSSQ